uniref:Uncharacterized protein n=1 Tax=Phocoena sinus TaxID=42100 RepID=A0A8C9BQT3_PHOSS
MSAKYLSCKEPSSYIYVGLTPHLPSPGTETHRPSRSQGHLTSITRMQIHTGPTLGLGHPHMLGLNAGLLGPEVAIVLITLMVPLTLFHPPLTLGHNELCEVRVQLVLLVDAPLLNAVPALLLRDAQSTGDVVPKVEPLLLGQVPTSLQVGNSLIIALHLQLALPQEEVCLHRLPVQLQGAPAVSQSLLMLLHLQVAQCPVGVIHRHQGIPGLENKAGRRLRVLAAHEEPVALLLELLRARALFRAAAAGAQPRAALLLLLALHGAARHGLGSAPRLRAGPALRPQPEPAIRSGPVQRSATGTSGRAGGRGQREGWPASGRGRAYTRREAEEGEGAGQAGEHALAATRRAASGA